LVSGGLLKIDFEFYDLRPPPWVTTQATNERCIEQVLVSGRFVVLAVWQFIELGVHIGSAAECVNDWFASVVIDLWERAIWSRK
jgi:hypothetical protein